LQINSKGEGEKNRQIYLHLTKKLSIEKTRVLKRKNTARSTICEFPPHKADES